MACLGVHFALDEKEVINLKSMGDERERLEYVTEEIEEIYFDGDKLYLAESDKSWDAMHRLLTDGELTWNGGEYPLNHTILGGELLYSNSDYIMSLKSPNQVMDVHNALKELTEDDFKKRYFRINPDSYGFPLSDEDCQYTWEYFHDVRELYVRATIDGRYVLFTADQ